MDVFHILGVFRAVGNLIVEFRVCCVEWIVWLEDVIIKPYLTIGNEQFSVQVISDSTTILHLSYHVLDSFP